MKPIRKRPINIAEEKRKEEALLKELDLDYELRSLSHAILTQDETERARALARLHELTADANG